MRPWGAELLDQAHLKATLGAWGELWGALEPAERARVVALLVERITWDGQEQTCAIRWRAEGLAGGNGKERA